MDDLKILRVIESMNPSYGGPCQGIRNSIPQLKTMESMNEVASIDAENIQWPVQDGFPVFKLGPGKGPWGYSRRLRSWLKANLSKYDIVVVHGLWQYYGYAVRKTIAALKIAGEKTPKFYIMPHGMLDPYFQKAPDRKLKALRNLMFWNLIERKTLNTADGVLFTCQEELLLARQTFNGYAPKREINVGYGILQPPPVDIEGIDCFRTKNGLAKNEKYFLFLSRIHPKKGLLNLVKAYSEFSKKMGTLPKLVVAGPGIDEEYGKLILNIVQNDLHLKDAVLFIGMVTGKEKWAAFYASEAFILPSHQENFGIAVAEALACKCPVLISNKVNIWREIVDGNGGIVTEDTFEGTYSLLNQFSKLSEEKVIAMKKGAYAVYQKHFTIEQAAIKFHRTLKSIET